MNLRWSERIGVRLGLVVAGVLILLALVANELTDVAFDRAARSVHHAGAAEFSDRARSALLAVTEREAQVIASSLERPAAAGRSAARYLARQMEALEAAPSAAPLAEAPSGHWRDPDPDRRSTLHVPDFAVDRPTALHDAAIGLALDDLFEALAPELGDGVGIYFLSPDGVIRYHPPIDFVPLVRPDFDATVQPVFQLATPEANPLGDTVWTPPYVDDVGNGLLVTAVSPVYADGAFRGAVDVDVSLERLAGRLAGITPLPQSFAFLLDARGHLIAASPGAAHSIGHGDDLVFGMPLDASLLRTLQVRAPGGAGGIVTLELPHGPSVIAMAPLPGTGWTLALGAPVSAISAPADDVAAAIAGEARRAQQGTAVASIVAFLLALGVLMTATRRWVVRPIGNLVAGARRLGAGELGIALPMGSSGEFRALGEAFNRMSGALAHQRAEILGHQRHLEQQVAERTHELASLLAISTDLGAAADVQSLLRSVVVRLRNAVQFGCGSVWVIEGSSLRPIIVATPPTGPARAASPLPSSVLDGLMERLRSGQPCAVSPAGNHHAWKALSGDAHASILISPLLHRNQLSGVLVLEDPVIAEAHQLDLLAAVAQQLGTVLENVRLLAQARERSALEERQHLARELHDSVSQALFGVVLGLQTAQREITAPGRLRDSVEYASELADAALQEMRALIFELRPESLESEGLEGLLHRQADMLRARHEIEVGLRVAEPPIALDAKAVLYRVAQEALHNVVKHARARHVHVTLEEAGGSVRLEVRDDGRGFAIGSQGAESFGLHSMQERMALLGGRLEVTSEAGRGTRVAASLPLAAMTPIGAASA